MRCCEMIVSTAGSWRRLTSVWSQWRCRANVQWRRVIITGSTFVPLCSVLASHAPKVHTYSTLTSAHIVCTAARCGLFLRVSVRSVVCLFVCLLRPWALQKWLNWPGRLFGRRGEVGAESSWPKRTVYQWGTHGRQMANTIERSVHGGGLSLPLL